MKRKWFQKQVGPRSRNFGRFSRPWYVSYIIKFPCISYRKICSQHDLLQHNRMDNILDAEIAWREFCWDVANLDGLNNNSLRYVRINPNLNYDPPSMDDVSQLQRLQEETRKALKSEDSLAHIERVAHTLAASSFYYERTAAPRTDTDMFSCSGLLYHPKAHHT